MRMETFGKFQFKIRDACFDASILDEETKPMYYRIPPSPKVVIDIGAHIGGNVVLCASLGATVHAFEPAKANYDLLLENIQLNDVKANCFNKAVGIPGKRILHTFLHNTGLGTLKDKTSPMQEEVEVISIQEVFKDILYCDFLKIDCEESEYEFLLDIPFDKIAQISMELHTGPQMEMLEVLKQHYKVEYKPAIDGTSLMVFCTERMYDD